MSGDTLGDCPFCGHKESSYDAWESAGYKRLPDWRGELMFVRLWKCKYCSAVATPDFDRTEDGSRASAGLTLVKES